MSGQDFFRDGKERPLILGQSFYNDNKDEYLTLKYDFKPPHGDSQEKEIEVDSSKNVTVTMKDEQSGESVYKGSENEATRECLLIIDHVNQTITLEKVKKKMLVKRTRKPGAGSGRASNAHQIDSGPRMPVHSASHTANSMPSIDLEEDEQQPLHQTSQPNGQVKSQFDSSDSSSSSDSSDSSDSESDEAEDKNESKPQPSKPLPGQPNRNGLSNMLLNDLDLSSASDEEE